MLPAGGDTRGTLRRDSSVDDRFDGRLYAGAVAELRDLERLLAMLPGVCEGVHYGRRTWSVASKAFVWERPFSKADIKRFAGGPVPQGPVLALVTDGLEDKEALLQAHPGYLFTIPHFTNYPALLLHLSRASAEELRESLLDAWLVHAPSDVARAHLERPSE